MADSGWKSLLSTGAPPFEGESKFRIQAYSEFMPPPWLGLSPYDGRIDETLFSEGDPWGWRVPEVQELCELRPGMEHVAQTLFKALERLMQGSPSHGISKFELEGNPYWPGSSQARKRPETFLLPLALSRTQDDKGRVRWTLFGGSHLGPDAAFWKSFFTAPGKELPESEALETLRRLVATAYPELAPELGDLRKAGLRILPRAGVAEESEWPEPELPSWTSRFLPSADESPEETKLLLTFRRFSALPDEYRRSYLEGGLKLVPSPESLIFWDRRAFGPLEDALSYATQIPLLLLFRRHEGEGLRIPQSGLLHEDKGEPAPDSPRLRNSYRRSSRHDRNPRHLDILAFEGREARLAKALFSSLPDDTGLYDKPMAKNCQIWNSSHRPVLDGPKASPGELLCARSVVLRGGTFGYRFLFPPMRVAGHEVFWHRPLAAAFNPSSSKLELLPFGAEPSGFLLAGRPGGALRDAAELWPRFDRRPEWLAAAKLTIRDPENQHRRRFPRRALNILSASESLGGRIPAAAAARVARVKPESLPALLDRTEDSDGAERRIASALESRIDKASGKLPEPITFQRTATRKFETDYWSLIRLLSSGEFQNKNNADCVLDEPTRKRRLSGERGLDPLGDHLLDRHWKSIGKSGVAGAFAAEIPFVWDGVFDFEWQRGWLDNRLGKKRERDLIVAIPGKDRSKAVILADHYDTAYMEDIFYNERGGDGARLSAAGADDNHSATATLLLAAPIFLELSKEGKLESDVWLIHLTGEEFPSDCMGARSLAQLLVERRLAAIMPDGSRVDLSKTAIEALYVMDMIAHNNDKYPDIFQISPGAWPSALKAALHAHAANEIWNSLAPEWTKSQGRHGLPRPPRGSSGDAPPPAAPFPMLSGEIRLHSSRRSSLYNTDGQIFSDAGLPAVLIMENYDLNRQGYHDTHDTMKNIDLDYGAAVAAISIEATAIAASGARRAI